MMIGPGPRMRMVLISVRFLTTAPVFHASNGASSFDGFGGATTAFTCTALCCLPTLRVCGAASFWPLKKADLTAHGTVYSSSREVCRHCPAIALVWSFLTQYDCAQKHMGWFWSKERLLKVQGGSPFRILGSINAWRGRIVNKGLCITDTRTVPNSCCVSTPQVEYIVCRIGLTADGGKGS